jgi:hypothetical protein
MKTRIHVLLVLFALTTSFSALSQLTISGTVKDEEGNPLQGMRIDISNTYSFATTGSDGKYTLTGLGNGNYVINAKGVGFASQSYEILLFDKNLNLDLVMKSSVIMIEEVQAFRDEIYDRYFTATLEYYEQYQALKKSRSVEKLLDL